MDEAQRTKAVRARHKEAVKQAQATLQYETSSERSPSRERRFAHFIIDLEAAHSSAEARNQELESRREEYLDTIRNLMTQRAELEAHIGRLREALELAWQWIGGPGPRDAFSYDSLREDAWKKWQALKSSAPAESLERLRKLEAVWEAAIEQRDSLRSHEAINGRLRDALSALDAEVKK